MRVEQNSTYYYMYNGHADVTALLNAQTGNTDATYYYDSFGTVLSQTGNVSNSYLYAGYQYDEETGLYYLNARMYDSETARFVQEDTYRGNPNDPLSLNLYTYCANNPLVYHDPTGHFGEKLKKTVVKAWNWFTNTPDNPVPDVEDNGSSKNKTSNSKGKGYSGGGTGGGSRIGNEAPKKSKNSKASKNSKTTKKDSGYLGKTANQVIKGNYTKDVTGLGIVIQLGIGVVGIDLPADARDVWYDISNWKTTSEHIEQTAWDVIAFIPVIGSLKPLKYADEVSDVAKHSDELVDAGKRGLHSGSKGGLKSVDDILESANPGRVTKGKTTQWNKTGGMEQALDDFGNLGVTDIKDIPGGKVGKLPDGRTVNVRTKSSDGRPTLEIFDGKSSTKIRYDK